LNRVIWPKEYRPKGLSNFKCYACTAGRETIVDVETTANKLSKENTTGWLIHTDETAAALEVFNKRSLFHTISQIGTENFASGVHLFSELGANKSLTLKGKLVRNTPLTELKSWISRRQTESGTCSLCFSSKRKTDLMLACGRTGCTQRICKDCLQNWYGLNAPGRIINFAALSCAFCRRAPAPSTLDKYGMGIHAVADLKKAVRESGTWISAWCTKCGHAKRYLQRVCAAGAPPDLTDWSCEDCNRVQEEDNNMELGCMNMYFVKAKECPGCGVMTEKVGGCDHITCSTPKCGAHWCWFCGEKFKQTNLEPLTFYDRISDDGTAAFYNHIQLDHGGFYDD
jgi:hypothetical protein